MRECFVVKFSETMHVSPRFFWPFFALGPRMFQTHLVLVSYPCLGTSHFSREPQFLLAENDILNQDLLLGCHCSKMITLNRARHIKYPSSWCSGFDIPNPSMSTCPLGPGILCQLIMHLNILLSTQPLILLMRLTLPVWTSLYLPRALIHQTKLLVKDSVLTLLGLCLPVAGMNAFQARTPHTGSPASSCSSPQDSSMLLAVIVIYFICTAICIPRW